MPVFIALLRGINVGTAKRVAMADLRSLFFELGYKDVVTLLNSGNVVFSGSKVSEAGLESAFEKRFGFSSNMTVIGAAELRSIVEQNPIAEIPEHSRFFVAFMKNAAQREKLLPLSREVWHPGVLAIGERAAYLWCPEGSLESPLSKALNKALKDGVTVRNWATVLKLLKTLPA
jgi:uncharacterized protein (DUF1697 family)